MTEFIVRLTDEQEALLRRFNNRTSTLADVLDLGSVGSSLVTQACDALALYDQLVAEAKAVSDD